MRGMRVLAAVLAVGAGVATPGWAAPRPASNARSPAVIPFPGTPDAAPASQVIFQGLFPAALRRVIVQGSHTGLHRGRLTKLPDGAGAAFVPAHPFARGERVTVSAWLRSASTSGPPGDQVGGRIHFSFGVAQPTHNASSPAARTGRTSGSPPPWQKFRSEPDLHPPIVHLDNDVDRSADIFLTPVNSGQLGPMMVNGRGQLVWFRRTGRLTAFNFEEQQYLGHPVLTWWEGRVIAGHGADGHDIILDSHYRTVANLRAGYGYSSDLHEFQLASPGRALIDAYVPVQANLSSVGGPSNGQVLDCVIQELDVRTGRVLWEWHALGHVPLSASYQGVPSDTTPFDYFHLNSIQQLPGGRLIISARNTWAVYMVDEHTGRVLWTLGGKYSSYRMGSGTNFEWQHDARLHRHGLLTLFDDGAFPQEESESSAKELRINTRTGLVSLVHRFTHSPPLLAGSEGNAQLLPNGNLMVGWGSVSGFSEYTSAGREILDGRFRLGVNSYRAFRFGWTGQPTNPPSLAVVPRSDGSTSLYASWNGATQVASWEVLGGSTRKGLIPLTARSVTGFETAVRVHNEPRYFAVRALDAAGHVLGRSFIHRAPPHVAIFGPSAFVSASTGVLVIPVVCVTHHPCHLSLSLRAGRTVLGPTSSATLHPRTGTLVPFVLSAAGMTALGRAPHHHLRVRVTARANSGPQASRQITLVAYSTSGPSPPRNLSQSPTVHLLGTSEYVSPQGAGGILAACYGPAPCVIKETFSAGNAVIAQSGIHYLGADEVGYLGFRLTPTGQSMLSQAPGNQLPARVTLSNGGSVASGQVVLSRYS